MCGSAPACRRCRHAPDWRVPRARIEEQPMSLFDYPTLRLLWWAFLGLLLIGFAVTDGYDLGAGVLQPFVARTDTEKRMLLNALGPFWEGNQVWFVLAGGAAFAAWPPL